MGDCPDKKCEECSFEKIIEEILHCKFTCDAGPLEHHRGWAALLGEVKVIKNLLDMADCPECDGTGIITEQCGDGNFESRQCEWCDTKNQVLGEKT